MSALWTAERGIEDVGESVADVEPGILLRARLPRLVIAPFGIITGENQLGGGVSKAADAGDMRNVGPLWMFGHEPGDFPSPLGRHLSDQGGQFGQFGQLRDAGHERTPGDPNAGPPPAFETPSDSLLNWQNHLSYLRLAELVDADESAECYRNVFSRFEWLARRELGCRLSELAGVSEGALVEDAKNIILANLAHAGIAQGPHAGLRFVASPLWVAGTDGSAVREAALIPAGFVDYYFGGPLASPDVTEAVSRLAAQCVVRYASQPWTISFMTKGAREMYTGSGVASAPVAGTSYRPWHFLLSAVIAETARYLRAEATDEELRHVFGLNGGVAGLSPSLQSKMASLESWETDQYSSGIGVGILGPS